MSEKKYLEIIDENDNVIKYEIIMAFKIENTNKFYVVYTDNTYNENNELNLYAASYDPSDDTKFELITDEKERSIVISRVKNLINEK